LKEERAIRTVFIQNLPLDATEKRVEEWFDSHDCPVRDVQLVVDKQRKFKGLAYVELYQKESVHVALTLNGQSFQGRPVSIESSNAEKNQGFASQAAAIEARLAESSHPAPIEPLLRLYLGNLDYGITQDMLYDLLIPFGPLESVRLQTEANGHSKGHAFIQFHHKEHALAAFHKLNATPLAGRQLRCDFTKDARARDPDLPPSPPMISSRTTYFPETGSAVQHAQTTGVIKPPTAQVGNLDDEMNGSSASMHNLIQRLAASSTSASGSITAANVIHHPPAQDAPPMPNPLIPIIDKSSLPDPGRSTNCLLLKNVFDPSIETNPDFDKEIEGDVAGEAENFGTLTHILVDKHSFVRCSNKASILSPSFILLLRLSLTYVDLLSF
jgi:RNA-binding protein 39